MNRYNTPEVYAGWSIDEDNRFESTSGGAFCEFAKVVLSEGGFIAGAIYNEDNYVEHDIVDNYSDLFKVRQSKYMSSSIGETYKRVRELLESQKRVLFCGSPCQVAGLYSFLGEDVNNLLTIDFICRGMNSPKAFHAWLKEIEGEELSKAKRVWFKYKEGGWKSSPRRTRIDFIDGHYKIYEGNNNLYMYGYLNTNLYVRPCCGECKFKGVPRQSDITLADFWGIESELDDDKGTSMILVNSSKGKKYFNTVKKKLVYKKKDFDSIVQENPMFVESIEISPVSSKFLLDLDTVTFSDCLKKYGCAPEKDSVVRKVLRKIKKSIKNLWGVR